VNYGQVIGVDKVGLIGRYQLIEQLPALVGLAREHIQ
jgi:hypothetical protein